MTTVRYSILAKNGLIVDTTLIKKVVATVPKQVPTLIVYVAPTDQAAFEKQLETDPKVSAYDVDYRTPGIVPKKWTRK